MPHRMGALTGTARRAPEAETHWQRWERAAGEREAGMGAVLEGAEGGAAMAGAMAGGPMGWAGHPSRG